MDDVHFDFDEEKTATNRDSSKDIKSTDDKLETFINFKDGEVKWT